MTESGQLVIARRTRLSLVLLATSAFCYVTAETLPAGLLPQLSRGLHVPEGNVGLLVTVYAAVAGIGAIPVTAWSGHIPRRRIVVVSIVTLAVSQLAMSVAPNYGFVIAARIVCALAHGVFWSVLPSVAASLVSREHSGRATSIVFAGSAVALVLGTPLATAVGEEFGWRAAEALVGVVAGVTAVVLGVVLPAMNSAVERAPIRVRLAGVGVMFRRSTLLVICAITVLVVTAQFSVYTFIAPLVRRDGHLHGLALAVVLLLYGGAGIVSNAVNGRIVDRRPRLVALNGVLLVVVALGMLDVLGPGSALWTILAVVVWGSAFGAIPLSLQTTVLRLAPDAPDNASSLLVVAFQIGIGGGALLGALVDRAGHVATLPTIGMALAALGALVVLSARKTFATRPISASPDDQAAALVGTLL